MKFYKFLAFFIFFTLQVGAEDMKNEYKIEMLIYKYNQAIANEEFKTFYEIPNGNHIKYFDNKINSKNSNFSNIADYIDAVLSKDISNAEKLYPNIWYRDSNEIIKLNKLKNNLNKNNDTTILKSKSWIQTIPEVKSDRFLMYIDNLICLSIKIISIFKIKISLGIICIYSIVCIVLNFHNNFLS